MKDSFYFGDTLVLANIVMSYPDGLQVEGLES